MEKNLEVREEQQEVTEIMTIQVTTIAKNVSKKTADIIFKEREKRAEEIKNAIKEACEADDVTVQVQYFVRDQKVEEPATNDEVCEACKISGIE